MTRTERLLRLAKLRGDRAAELILTPHRFAPIAAIPGYGGWRLVKCQCGLRHDEHPQWTEAELRAAWGDR